MKKIIQELAKDMSEEGCEAKLNYSNIKVVGPFLSLLLCQEEMNHITSTIQGFSNKQIARKLALRVSSILFSQRMLGAEKKDKVLENRTANDVVQILKAMMRRNKHLHKMVS